MEKKENKILFVLLPVWDPLIPPLGISSLKSYIQDYGYQVKTKDLNVEEELGGLSTEYFQKLKEYIPLKKRRHINNIGHEVLKNHMMAHVNYKNDKAYQELVKELVAKTFYHSINDQQVETLIKPVAKYYQQLNNYILDLLQAEEPEILGFSVYSGTLASTLYAAKLAKDTRPSIQILLGGGIFSGELEIASLNFKKFLDQSPYIDKVFIGEGEKLLLHYLEGKLPESQKVFTIEDLEGDLVAIETAPIPDFSDYDLNYYMQMASYSSRSCPFQCNFCVETTYWGKYRKRSAHKIYTEMKELYEQYGKRLFLMCDSLLNPIVEELSDEFLKSKTTLYWGGYLRVENKVCELSNSIKWRKGGVYRARLGVESGSQKVLDLMKKKIDLEKTKLAVSSLAMAGIKTTLMFVIGYPGETEEDFQLTLNLVEELKGSIYEADCNPFWFFFTGQINSEEWKKTKRVIPLYSENAEEMLLYQTWTIRENPTRESTYKRVNRFIQHCQKLDIPNPYTMNEMNQADLRWKRLQKNAVPSLMEIYMDTADKEEWKKVKEFHEAKNTKTIEGDWNF